MNQADFEAMVRDMYGEVPQEFLDGVAEVTVSARTVPHPIRAGVYTLGECIPLALEPGSAATVLSRIVLYYGSFLALAELQRGFDWRKEVWETLTHELRHHLEWRAHAPDLEAFDGAMEQNFARQEGEAFDPAFYLDGESVADGVYHIEGDYFIEQLTTSVPAFAPFTWQGVKYRIRIPPDAVLPAYLIVQHVADPPPGDLVVVLQWKPGLHALLQGRRVFKATVDAEREV